MDCLPSNCEIYIVMNMTLKMHANYLLIYRKNYDKILIYTPLLIYNINVPLTRSGYHISSMKVTYHNQTKIHARICISAMDETT